MIWELVEYFTPEENWGDPDKISGLLILTIDAVRKVYGEDPSLHSFIIHNAYETSGHSAHSQHYLGKALDYHIVDKYHPPDPFPLQVDKTLRALQELQIDNHVGLGIYPDWDIPGFHLDVRGEKARWGRVGGEYVSIKWALEQCGTISG